ncbi:TonB-dependent receptor plug domain-containing protein [Winogradskyella sp. 3972H.M.0a.05]|uniref:TonB-dependent receptor plug domain-containing protein n=1 Tax=Winogradskyella sp. 3972H.M.0a.05 TaxID=2950277 RepID=UPI0033993607
MRSLFILFFSLFFIYNSFSQKQTQILWDVSLSMKDRDIEKDLDFLNNYFKKYNDVEVALVLFNYRFIDKKIYKVTEGDWSSIKDYLQKVKYDGATSFEGIEIGETDNDILLFTDGKEKIFLSNSTIKGNLYVINSSKNFDKHKLSYLAFTNSGKLINLSKNYSFSQSNEAQKIYQGKLYHDDPTIDKVEVYIKEQDKIVINPKIDNSYEIKGKPGDSLILKIDNQKEIVKVLGENNNLNIWLEEGNIRLDEVLVDAKTTNNVDEDKVKTAYGNQNKDGVGYRVKSVDGDDLLKGGTTDVSSAVRGKFASLNSSSSEDLSQTIIRGPSSFLLNNYALIVVDGTPITSSDSSSGQFFRPGLQTTSYLDPNNIADVTVLNGLAATNRFGSRGANGVILITTKTAAGAGLKSKQEDLALVKNNIYDENTLSTIQAKIPYIKTLKKAKTIEEAFDAYLEQRDKFSNKPEYFIDVYDFFRPTNRSLAYQVLSNILELDQPTAAQLRVVRFKALSDANNKFALEAALKMLELYPNKVQSYLDLAETYRDTQNHQKALDLYLKIDDGTINPKLNFSGVNKIVDAEIRNLVFHHKSKLNTSRIRPEYLNNITYNARLVFEWSSEDAPFEIQFVNPQKRFFNWEYSLEKRKDRYKDGIDQGFGKEQFEVYDDGIGEWLINAKSLAKQSKNKSPIFLMCTVYNNYGSPTQKAKRYTLRLDSKSGSQQLAKIKVN